MRLNNIQLKPAEGRRVRHRDGRLFAEAGESVPSSSFYLRLLDAGDLIETTEPTTKPAGAKSSGTPKGKPASSSEAAGQKGRS